MANKSSAKLAVLSFMLALSCAVAVAQTWSSSDSGIRPDRDTDRLEMEDDDEEAVTDNCSLQQKCPAALRAIVRLAAMTVGVDPDLLVIIGQMESRMKPLAANPGSSARGLFQFTEEGWLLAVMAFGHNYGMAESAKSITINSQNGKPVVATSAMRDAILARRIEPALSALLAAEMARDNRRRFADRIGRTPTATETYLLHLTGLPTTLKLTRAATHAPQTRVAGLVSDLALRKNGPIFLDRTGQARTIEDMHKVIAERMVQAQAEVGTPINLIAQR